MPSDIELEIKMFRKEVAQRIQRDAEHLASLEALYAEIELEKILEQFDESAVVMHCLVDEWTEDDRYNFAASKKRYYLTKLIAALETLPKKILPIIIYMIEEDGNCPDYWRLK